MAFQQQVAAAFKAQLAAGSLAKPAPPPGMMGRGGGPPPGMYGGPPPGMGRGAPSLALALTLTLPQRVVVTSVGRLQAWAVVRPP